MRNQPPEFAQVVLDSLTAHIAVLDAEGVIIGVNEPWRRFAEDNQGEIRQHYVGRNYLQVCENAQVCGDDVSAPALLEGLRAVLSQTRDHFELEYPCHAPGLERWFIARITRCTQGGASRVVVSHEDITARKQAELALARTERELQEALQREQAAARSDELTGLCNRRHFLSLAEPLFQAADRYQQPLSLVMMDVDHFKRVNDRHGHPTGDRALQAIAQCAATRLRSADLLARYGGEEFILLLPGTDAAQAMTVAEAIRTAVAERALAGDRGRVALSVSAGIAERQARGDTLMAMIRRADEALYAAKAAGRNRCQVFEPAPLGRLA